jgi:linoleoyl-CoA desaturase
MSIQKPIKFTSKEKTDFLVVLKARVEEYFKNKGISKNYNAQMIIKTGILLSGYLLPFTALLLFQPSFGFSMLLWIIMGISVAGIGMSIMHDANHGAYSKNELTNKLLGHTLNLIGGSVGNWKFQHNMLHHMYTNVAGVDDDIQDRYLLKLSPHYTAKSFHKFQKYYAFLFYGIITLYWVLMKDFVQLNSYAKTDLNTDPEKGTAWLLARTLFDKVLYLFVIIGVPIIFFHIPALYVIAGFVVMHVFAGIILTVIFQLAHTVEGTSHPMPNESGNIENNWAIHQLNTTVNFSPKNAFISWYVGGLNYQIEHHLFSKICHVHYPHIAPIVEATAREYNVPYMVNKTFWGAFKSHIKALEKFGAMPSLNDAIG